VASGRDFLGPYRLVRLVRAGQSCQVWEAVKQPDTTRIALKVLLEEHIKKKEEVAYLKHEAEVGATLNNKYVIKIFEFNFDYGLPFLAMELFNAKNLKQDLRERKDFIAHYLPDIVRRCGKALAYLHSQGWVHCDVKPDNYLVDENAQIKLIDFAITQKEKKPNFLSSLFGGRTKSVQGTRSYMSPEQIRRTGLDARSDIYSFGCVMYEMLSGKPPYSGVNPDDLLSKHLRAAPPNVQAANQRSSPEVADLIIRMIAKNPDKRPESMNAVLNELSKISVYRPGKRPPPPEEIAKAPSGN
jgi:eukaryotic-like serine/threonine-protein kinase